jgi:hypothetical protein
MERLGALSHQLARSPTHQNDIPLCRRLASGLGKPVDVTLVRRMQPEPVGQADGFFVERLELGVGEMLELRRTVQVTKKQTLTTASQE